jgi:methyl-accepting chemotaxis protein
MHTELPPTYYIIFTAVTSLGVLLQACVLLAMYIGLRQTTRKLHEATDELRQHALPTIATARSLLEDISPKLKVVSTNLVEASKSLRQQADHVNATVEDLMNKTNAQAARVDGIVTASIDSAAHATEAVQHAFAVPVRQISGLVAGLKAGFEVLRRKNHVEHIVEDDFGE